MSSSAAQQPASAPAKKKNRYHSLSAIGIAIAIHAVILIILALIVVLPAVSAGPEITVHSVSAVSENPERKKLEVQQQSRVRQPSAAASAIQAQTMASVSIAKPEISDAPVGLGKVELDQSSFAGQLGREGGKSLFGTPVNAKKLGVLFDWSGSMKPFRGPVFDEIEMTFPDSIIVFQMGCGMGNKSDAPEIYQITPEVRIPEGLPMAVRQRAEYQAQRFKGKGFAGSRLARFIEENQNTSYYLPIERAGMQALDVMRGLGVDSVFWFADFGDQANPEAVSKYLSKHGLKLYISYPPAKADASERQRGARKAFGRVAEKSGGKVIPFGKDPAAVSQ